MTAYFRRFAKSLAMTAPPVRQLVESRRTLLAERDDAVAKSNKFQQERDDAIAKGEEIRQARHDVHSQIATLADENAALSAQNTALVQEKDDILARVHSDLDKLHRFGEGPPFVPNGHFYSPIPSLTELERHKARIFGDVPRTLPGIDLNEDGQRALLDTFLPMYRDLPFADEKTPGLRYNYINPAYGYSDAIFLNLMLRHVRPKRVIEVGSGYSSCMLLDTNERWFDNSIACTFVEPYPELLYSLLKEGDAERVTIVPTGIQEVDLDLFSTLEANDVLFIDSTHVSKVGSDVNQIIFNVLPRLASGVFVHFHDIFYPFEYPEQWVQQGRAWNEAYMLKAFLQYNAGFEIVMFNTFMEHFHLAYFEQNMPLCLKNTGASIWLRKR